MSFLGFEICILKYSMSFKQQFENFLISHVDYPADSLAPSLNVHKVNAPKSFLMASNCLRYWEW